MSLVVDVPREPLPDPLPREAPLEGRPEEGQWIMGINWPLCVWWRCPLCRGVVPIDLDEVDETGLVVDGMHHTKGNKEGSPRCAWGGYLRLLDYDRGEHERLVDQVARKTEK